MPDTTIIITLGILAVAMIFFIVGKLRVDLQLEATPRVLVPARKGRARKLSLEHRIDVRTHREQFMKDALERTHLQSRGLLTGLEEGGYRIVFSVDDTLFALDLELNHQV